MRVTPRGAGAPSTASQLCGTTTGCTPDMLIVPAEHEQGHVLVARIHQAVKVSSLQHCEMAGFEGAYFKTAVAGRHLRPVAHYHIAATVHHEENLLIVAVPMQADSAVRLEDVQ